MNTRTRIKDRPNWGRSTEMGRAALSPMVLRRLPSLAFCIRVASHIRMPTSYRANLRRTFKAAHAFRQLISCGNSSSRCFLRGPMKAPGPRPVPDRPCLKGVLYVLHTGSSSRAIRWRCHVVDWDCLTARRGRVGSGAGPVPRPRRQGRRRRCTGNAREVPSGSRRPHRRGSSGPGPGPAS